MSNTLAIAAVTATLRYLLERALAAPHAGPVGGASVTTLRLDQLASGDLADTAGLNVLLYQLTPHATGNLTEMSTRNAAGELLSRPRAAIDLHYLITAFGAETALEGQRLIARAQLALAASSILTRDLIASARAVHGTGSETPFLSQSDLEDQVDRVKLSPLPLTLEDHTRLWGLFPGAPFQLSVAYRASAVLLEAETPTLQPLPVRARVLTVHAGARPQLESLAPVTPNTPVVTGTALRLLGGGLSAGPGTRTEVQIGTVRLFPDDEATGTQITVVLPPEVPAGIQTVRVLHVRPSPGPGGPPEKIEASSNARPITVHPRLEVASVSASEITLRLIPSVTAGQRATLRLDRIDGPADGPDAGPITLALDPIPPGGPPQSTAVVERSAVPDGTWLVRMDTDGVSSIPEPISGGDGLGPQVELD